MSIAGIVLAAGAGTRAGGPKALRTEPDGRAWVAIAAEALLGAGCSPVFVVLGAAAEDAAALVPHWAPTVLNPAWADGLSTSLHAGLDALDADPECDGALVTLVDMPWQTANQAREVIALIDASAPRAALARALVDGRPAHPVFLGRDHFAAIAASVTGDHGAGEYLRAHAGTLRHTL